MPWGERKPNVPRNITFENVVILGEAVTRAEDMGLTVSPYCENLRFC